MTALADLLQTEPTLPLLPNESRRADAGYGARESGVVRQVCRTGDASTVARPGSAFRIVRPDFVIRSRRCITGNWRWRRCLATGALPLSIGSLTVAAQLQSR